MRTWLTVPIVALMCLVAAPARSIAAEAGASTPAELVAAYDDLADTILAAKNAEKNMVHAILATTFAHAESVMGKARTKVGARQDCKADLEKLAALVSQLGNEGDASVAGIRKRLLEGGHHHNAAGEQQGIYDEGFVVVTRAAKKVFLDAAAKIGRMAAAPDAAALETEWKAVEKQYREFGGPAR